jgi:hypothetical protein
MSEGLRVGTLKPVFHGAPEILTLKELVRNYNNLVDDSTWVMVRIKALFRARAITTAGRVGVPGNTAHAVADEARGRSSRSSGRRRSANDPAVARDRCWTEFEASILLRVERESAILSVECICQSLGHHDAIAASRDSDDRDWSLACSVWNSIFLRALISSQAQGECRLVDRLFQPCCESVRTLIRAPFFEVKSLNLLRSRPYRNQCLCLSHSVLNCRFC